MKNSETFSNSSTFFVLMGIDLLMFANVLFQDVIIMESLFYLAVIFWALTIGAIISLFKEGELF
jgi:hypothetical protein